MSDTIDFLGVTSCLQQAVTSGVVQCFPWERLVAKVRDHILQAQKNNVLTPAQAAKLRGMLTFTSQAMAGRIGRAAMGPLKQRQYVDSPPWTLSLSL
eukprot:4126593-Amphidinium_carterae.1